MRRLVAIAIVAIAALAIVLGAGGSSGSPTRIAIAYIAGTAASAPQLWLADLSGHHRQRLGSAQQPLISPDGSLVAASLVGGHGAALELYSTSGGRSAAYFGVRRATAVAVSFSPDSRYLAVILSSTNPASSTASGLAVIDTRRRSFRLLARGPVDGAAFAPDGTDRIVYGAARSSSLAAQVNLYRSAADGSGEIRLSHDGRSLNPIWGRSSIAYDRERLRSGGAPVYQLWLMASDGSHRRQLTRQPVPPLQDGLVPLGFSADGQRLLAQYEGQDTSAAWTVTLASGRARGLRIGGQAVSAGSISRSGASVLVDRGGFLSPGDSGVIESIPFAGGPARTLVAHGSEPSWNR